MINTILNEIYGMDLKKSMSEALERALYASICGTSLTRNVSNLFLGKIPLLETLIVQLLERVLLKVLVMI